MSDHSSPKSVYLDYMSSTPLDEAVLGAMLPFFKYDFGNPHADHMHGYVAGKAIDAARQEIANVIHAPSADDIIFTSSATESNNLAILGLSDFLLRDNRRHIITQQTEHESVLQCFCALEKLNYRVTYLPVQPSGVVDIDLLEQSLTPDTGLVSIMGVNNEIGTIQPLDKIGAVIKKNNEKTVFHCDAAQCIGRIAVDIERMHIDLLSMSSHKTYGPKGVGALYVRDMLRKSVKPLIVGGGQETGLRSGTLPTPLCVGMGKAFTISEAMRENENVRLEKLRNQFIEGLKAADISFTIHGTMEHRIAANLNISIHDVKSEDLLSTLTKVSLSSGSACHAGHTRYSYVINALGVSSARQAEVVRISFGRQTQEADIENAVSILVSCINDIKSVS